MDVQVIINAFNMLSIENMALLDEFNEKMVKTLNDLKYAKDLSENNAVLTVSFIWTWLILILNSLCLKSLPKTNLSPSSISRPCSIEDHK